MRRPWPSCRRRRARASRAGVLWKASAVMLAKSARRGRQRSRVAASMWVALGLLLSACGGGSDDGASSPSSSAVSLEQPSSHALALKPGNKRRAHAYDRKGVTAIVVAPDGNAIGAANSDGRVRVLDASDARDLRVLKGQGGSSASGLIFSPDGRYLVSVGRDSVAQVWNVETGAERFTYRGPGHALRSVAASADGSVIATGGEETRVMVWDGTTGRLKRILGGLTDFVNALSVSPDGRYLASGDADARVLVWEIARGDWSTRCAAMRMKSTQWPSALTASCWSARARTARCSSGTWRPPPGASPGRPTRTGARPRLQPRWRAAGQRSGRRQGGGLGHGHAKCRVGSRGFEHRGQHGRIQRQEGLRRQRGGPCSFVERLPRRGLKACCHTKALALYEWSSANAFAKARCAARDGRRSRDPRSEHRRPVAGQARRGFLLVTLALLWCLARMAPMASPATAQGPGGPSRGSTFPDRRLRQVLRRRSCVPTPEHLRRGRHLATLTPHPRCLRHGAARGGCRSARRR